MASCAAMLPHPPGEHSASYARQVLLLGFLEWAWCYLTNNVLTDELFCSPKGLRPHGDTLLQGQAR